MSTLTHIDKLRNPNYLGGWDLLDENGKTAEIREDKLKQLLK